jgi:hypothetical protein
MVGGQWADAQNLTTRSGPLYFLEFLVAGLIVTLVHELGHATVGMVLGLKLRALVVGPFNWRMREGKWEFQFLPAKTLSLGGATGVVPTTLQHFRSNQICMIAAGPFANLICGLLVFCASGHRARQSLGAGLVPSSRPFLCSHPLPTSSQLSPQPHTLMGRKFISCFRMAHRVTTTAQSRL